MSTVDKADSQARVGALMERLHDFMKAEQLTLTAMSRKTGINTGVLSRAFKGQGQYSIGIHGMVAIFTAFPKLNAAWLLLGHGSMYEGEGPGNLHYNALELQEQNDLLIQEKMHLEAKIEAYQELLKAIRGKDSSRTK